MTSPKHRSSNIFFGSVICVCIILSIVFNPDAGGFPSAALALLAFCLAIVWVVQTKINHNIDKQQLKPLTPAELQRYRVMRIIIGLLLVAMIIFAVTSN